MKKNNISISQSTVYHEDNKIKKSLAARALDFFRSRFLVMYLTGIDVLYILYK
jgi:hypothetical protein